MINNQKITLLVPCKNEEKIIPELIRKVPAYIDEILIIDNGSTDKTAAVARRLGARVISEPRTQKGIGYGYAHLMGLKYASGDFIVAMDGDDTYPIKSIANIIKHMEKSNWDFVSCNRLPLKSPNAISKIRQLGIYILNMEVFILYGYPIRDILTGMWILKKSIVPKLLLTQGDWNLSPEIKLAAINNPNVQFAEVHINHFERKHEISKQNIFRTGFGHLVYILRRRLTVDSHAYQFAKSCKRYIFATTRRLQLSKV
jgi:glycosyltransferase involved in cell wall biosynthesis